MAPTSGDSHGHPLCLHLCNFILCLFEQKFIQTKYKKYILFYRRQIDDIFAIWVPNPDNPAAWTSFINDLNSYCKLEWNTEDLSRKVNFLDITISINQKNEIEYCTYQKAMNRFLYIPAHSAHPPGVFKSLIFGLLNTYFRQNSRSQDFHTIVRKLFLRLLARGHQRDDLTPLFLQAVTTIVQNKKRRYEYLIQKGKEDLHSVKSAQDRQIFFHLPYHPRGIARRRIQSFYKEHCESPDNLGQDLRNLITDTGDHLRVSKLTVAYSRCKNIRDIVSRSKLQEFDNCKVSNFLGITGRVN